MENGRFMKVGDIPNTRGLVTDGVDNGDPILEPCEETINEVYLFYCNKIEQIDRIMKDGFSVCSKPVTLAESAQVADQTAGILTAPFLFQLCM